MNIELKEFLKKYSTIPNYFIDDFYKLQIAENVSSDFKMDLDILSDWLEARKDNLKIIIVGRYRKNKDYTISKITIKGKDGRPTEKIMLTNNTFLKICMLTRSKKGEMVRDYFVSLQELVNQYKDHIIDSMSRKIKQLENNQKPTVNSKSSVLYFFRTNEDIDDLIRLGRTNNLKKRLLSHNSSRSDDIEVLLILETEDADAVEACLKGLLKSKQYRKRKEVYQVDIDLVKQLAKGCKELQILSMKKSVKFHEDDKYFIAIKRENNE